MRRLWSCLFYGVCLFAVVFSLYWMALPPLTPPASDPAGEETPGSTEPTLAAQALPESGQARYYLCDEGGRVAVYACGADGAPDTRLTLTGIYVNLLPESDALRIKRGLRVYSERELAALLEDLGE